MWQEATRTYFLQAAIGGPIKIGQTGRDVRKRVAENQTGNGWPLVLLGHTDTVSESALHARLARDRSQGEWFNNTERVRQTIADVCPEAAARIIINPALDFPTAIRKPPSPTGKWIRRACGETAGFYASKDQIADAFEAIVPIDARCEAPKDDQCDCPSCCFQDVRFDLDLRMIEGYVVVEDKGLLAKVDAAFINASELDRLAYTDHVLDMLYRSLTLISDVECWTSIAIGRVADLDLIMPSSALRLLSPATAGGLPIGL